MITYIFLFCSVLFLCNSCQVPPKYPSDVSVEVERVWQHMSAYSLYQQRVPSEDIALQVTHPQNLISMIADTLFSPTTGKTYQIGRYYPRYETLLNELGYHTNAVYFRKLSNQVAYVHLRIFNSTAYDELNTFTNELKSITKVVFDLRNNPGGLIDECQQIIELFLPSNKPYLRSVYRRKSVVTGVFETYSDTLKTLVADQGPGSGWESKQIALLINKNSASASELLIQALRDVKDSNSVQIMGQSSFGKAIGQYVFLFIRSSGAGLKLTGLRFFPLFGKDYHEKGIKPDKIQDTVFSKQLIEAGLWLDASFLTSVDTIAFNDVIINNSINTSPVQDMPCFLIKQEL